MTSPLYASLQSEEFDQVDVKKRSKKGTTSEIYFMFSRQFKRTESYISELSPSIIHL